MEQSEAASISKNYSAQLRAALDFAEEDTLKKPLIETTTSPRGKEGFVIARTGCDDDASSFNMFKFLSLVNKRSWESKSPISLIEGSWKAVRLNNFMFLFGIKESKSIQKAFQVSPVTLRYDANFDTWIELEPFPHKVLYGPAIAQLKGEIFYIGGAEPPYSWCLDFLRYDNLRDLQIFNTVWKYQIEKNLWFEGKALPRKLYDAAAVGCPADGRVYVAGGKLDSADGLSRNCYAYIIEAGTWIAKPSMNISRFQYFMESVGEKLFVVGGKHDHHNPVPIEQYHVKHEQWSFVKFPEPIDTSTRMGFVSDKNIYILNDNSILHALKNNRRISQEIFNILKVDTSSVTTVPHDYALWSKDQRRRAIFEALKRISRDDDDNDDDDCDYYDDQPRWADGLIDSDCDISD